MMDVDYRYVRSLGKGAFGSVVAARSKSGERVAIKQNSIHRLTTGIGSLREVSLWKMSSHPFVVELQDVMTENPLSRRLVIRSPEGMKVDNSYLVMEQGDKSCARYRFRNPEDLRCFLKCVLLAIESMHAKNVVHRDVRPENILKVGDNFKLCDMGLASIYCMLEFETVPTSNHYMPPEVARGMASNLSIDIWSIAVVALELLFGRSFLNVTMSTPRSSILKNIQYQLRKLGEWLDHEWIAEPLQEMLEGMLEFEPEKRWTATQCLDSRFFQESQTEIEEVRRGTAVMPIDQPQISFENLPQEARTGLQIFRHFWEEKHPWCSVRMLVHALKLYFRYLSSSLVSKDLNTRLWEIRAFAVIYISIKIWSFEFASPFSEIVFEDLDGKDLEDIFVQFEKELCQTLNWELVVPTVFETSSKWSQVEIFLTSVLK